MDDFNHTCSRLGFDIPTEDEMAYITSITDRCRASVPMASLDLDRKARNVSRLIDKTTLFIYRNEYFVG